MQTLYGIHPVEEALKAGKRRFDHVLVARERRDDRLEAIVSLCKELKIRVRTELRETLTDMAHSPAHQGVVAIVRAQQFLTIEDILEPTGSPRLVLALDGIEDPQNLGALLRSSDGAGVDAVVMTERRAAPLSAVAAKAAAGAQEHLRIARVVNLVRSLEDLKRNNIWIIGLDERGTTDYDQFDFTGNCALVMGREGEGLHDLVRKTCDHLLRIPMAGGVSSLNVSAAGAVVLFEAFRQRRNKEPASPPAKAPRRTNPGSTLVQAKEAQRAGIVIDSCTKVTPQRQQPTIATRLQNPTTQSPAKESPPLTCNPSRNSNPEQKSKLGPFILSDQREPKDPRRALAAPSPPTQPNRPSRKPILANSKVIALLAATLDGSNGNLIGNAIAVDRLKTPNRQPSSSSVPSMRTAKQSMPSSPQQTSTVIRLPPRKISERSALTYTALDLDVRLRPTENAARRPRPHLRAQ